MKRFHITITDNETGETIYDTDTTAIIGGFENGDKTNTLVFTDCDFVDIACTLTAAKQAINAITKEGSRGRKLDKLTDKYMKDQAKKSN